MEVNPQEWHPKHALERITVVIDLNEGGVRVSTISGSSSGKRTNLWTVAYAQSHGVTVMEFVERIGWLVQGALIDRPTSQPSLERSMATNRDYDAPELPW